MKSKDNRGKKFKVAYLSHNKYKFPYSESHSG
jgi:hypothetical protein